MAVGAWACRLASIREASTRGLNWEFWCLQRWRVLDTLSLGESIQHKLGYQGKNSGMEKQVKYPVRRETSRTSRGTGPRPTSGPRSQPPSDPVPDSLTHRVICALYGHSPRPHSSPDERCYNLYHLLETLSNHGDFTLCQT